MSVISWNSETELEWIVDAPKSRPSEAWEWLVTN